MNTTCQFPFGLLHRGYNEEKHEIKYTEAEEDKIFTPQVVAGHYKYWYNGKEWQEDLGYDVYSYGWRNYDPAIGRFVTIDRYAEKYYNLTPYSYAGNNPIIQVDIQGDSIAKGKQMRRANRMERRLKRRIKKLNRKIDRRLRRGKNIGDMKERVAEMEQSIQDIEDMKSDTKYWYKFEKTKDIPITYKTKENEITMYMPNFKNMHEPRHGGQIARREYDIEDVGINGEPTETYGAEDEISAYKAEYASISGFGPYGDLPYLPKFTPTTQDAFLLITGQATMKDIYKKYMKHVRNIHHINKELLRNMYDTHGFNQVPIYRDRPSIWWDN